MSADLPALHAFQTAMALETEGLRLDSQTLERGISAVFADRSRGTYRIAEAGGKIVGCLLLTSEWSDWRNAEVQWIQSVYVAPFARKQGVYRALYEAVRSEADANPCITGLRLYVDGRNRGAQAAYEKLGMDGDHYRVFEWMKGSGKQ